MKKAIKENIILTKAAELSLPSNIAEQAVSRLAAGEVVGIAVSGKLASGKDTVAPSVLSRLNVRSIEHLFFAQPLKEEFNRVLDIMRAEPSASRAAMRLIEELAMPADGAERLTDDLFVFAQQHPDVTAYDRTPDVRVGLQYLGTDIRRNQDENWWVNQALVQALMSFADGRSIYYTDCRFPNEVEGAKSVGCMTVRLDITPETQAARLMGRDGLHIDPAAQTHPSETILDDYPHFDVRVSNDGPIEDALSAVLAAVSQRRL